MATLQETWECRLKDLEQSLNWLEKQTDKATSLDQRIHLLTLVNIEQLKLLRNSPDLQPTLPKGIPSYSSHTFPLDVARQDEEISSPGNAILAYTDGELSGCSVRLDSRNNDQIPLAEFNGVYLASGFSKVYLTSTAQSGCYLRLMVIRGMPGNVMAEMAVNITAQSIGNIEVDIAAQSVGTLDVNIAAVGIGTIDVDITAQSVGNLGIDIAAQTIGNLDINIAAQAGHLDMNIAASAVTIDVDVQNAYFFVRTEALQNLNIDIVAQTLGNLGVDIAAQTVGNLDVDIAAQTVGNLNVDIAAQTVGNLSIDIAAQTVGNIDINLAASAITLNVDVQNAYFYVRTEALQNLNVDITAQTVGNLDIDIAAQTVGNLDINIAAQAANLDINIAASAVTIDVDVQNAFFYVRTEALQNLNVDIVAQTIGNIDVDIAAQTVGNLNVDIAAQTVGNLSVDIAAQAVGNIDVDISAQTIGNLTIDVEAQSVAISTKPDWEAQAGNGFRVRGSYASLAAGSSVAVIDYTLPAGRELFINGVSFGIHANDISENGDAPQIGHVAINIGASDFSVVGGNGGGSCQFDTPFRVGPGVRLLVSVKNGANHVCDVTASVYGHELYVT